MKLFLNTFIYFTLRQVAVDKQAQLIIGILIHGIPHPIYDENEQIIVQLMRDNQILPMSPELYKVYEYVFSYPHPYPHIHR